MAHCGSPRSSVRTLAAAMATAAAVLSADVARVAADDAALAAESRLVRLKTRDGGLIHADEYGSGRHGVVLAHGGRFDKESWRPQALALSAAGFRAIAIDFRGYGRSRGPGQDDVFTAPLHLDVLAAVDYLRKTGATTVSAIGGSLGGDAAARAAATEPGSIGRLVLLGATPTGPAERLTCRKLYIMTRDDANADGPRLPGLRTHFANAPEPKALIVLDGSAHAQAMFGTAHADRIMREILGVLSTP
jgi:pimeloyl-ACP methyl ester carboxylesterase